MVEGAGRGGREQERAEHRLGRGRPAAMAVGAGGRARARAGRAGPVAVRGEGRGRGRAVWGHPERVVSACGRRKSSKTGARGARHRGSSTRAGGGEDGASPTLQRRGSARLGGAFGEEDGDAATQGRSGDGVRRGRPGRWRWSVRLRAATVGGSGAGISSPRHDACVRREVEGNEGSERGGASGGLVPDPDWIGRRGTAWGGSAGGWVRVS